MYIIFGCNKGEEGEELETTSQISDIIIEKCKEFNRKAFLCFIDYSKAFDYVRYSALWNALLALGIPAHLVELIQNLYNGQLACVRTVAGDSDWFSLGQGVRQGCILSPTSTYTQNASCDGYLTAMKEAYQFRGVSRMSHTRGAQ